MEEGSVVSVREPSGESITMPSEWLVVIGVTALLVGICYLILLVRDDE